MNDLERATKSAFGMVAYAGMSDRLPNICYYNNDEYQFQRPYSETTAKTIDDEVLKIINDEYARAKAILKEHSEGHNELAELLIKREVIFAEDVERIFGKRPWVSRSEEIIEDNTLTFSMLLTMPVNSHTVSPVTKAKRNIIASGLRKHVTTAATKKTPVMARVIRFFILSLIMAMRFD
jgi:hypothetical protein